MKKFKNSATNVATENAAQIASAATTENTNVCFMAMSPSQKKRAITDILNKYYIIKNNVVTHRTDFRKKTAEEIALGEALAESMEKGGTRLLPANIGQTVVDESLELRPLGKEINSMVNKITDADITTTPEYLRNLLESDVFPSYNPLQDYFNSLPNYEDGHDYIAQLAACVKMEGTDDPAFFTKMLRKWLVSIVASVMEEYKCNQIVLIICGKQGIGKSTFFANVVPEKLRRRYFTSKEIEMSNKDDQILLSTMMVLCMDELGNMQKKNVKKFKEFLTKIDVTLRQPYAHYNENYTRNCSFCGTSNDIHILFDMTGNRRFAPFEVTDIDLNALKEVDIDMVYAQAMSLYRSAFQYWIEKGPEQEELERHNKKFQNLDPDVKILLELYEPCEADDPNAKSMQVNEIAHEIYIKTGHYILRSRFGQFGKLMESVGFKPAKKSHGSIYRWVKEKPQTNAE